MTLRPNDYDRNGDIIPSGWKEEKGDLISRSALKEELANLLVSIDYLVNKTTIADKELAIFSVIDNAPTVADRYDEGFRDGYAKCINDMHEWKRKGAIEKWNRLYIKLFC